MKTPFNDSFVSKHVHPSAFVQDHTIADGDGQSQDEIMQRARFQDMAEGMINMLGWLHEIPFKRSDKRYARAVALRAIAMTWVVNPQRLNGQSLRSIAADFGGSGTAVVIARLSAEFSRKFKIKNCFKNHDWRN
jgi:hypothetical protein